MVAGPGIDDLLDGLLLNDLMATICRLLSSVLVETRIRGMVSGIC
jgi:hypothetical protein